MVRCVDCGFLALRSLADRQLVEAEDHYRTTGEPIEDQGGRPFYEDMPLCFKKAYDLRQEIVRGLSPSTTTSYIVSLILLTQRNCKRFTDWQQGFTPKEHQESLDRNRAEFRQKFQLILIIVGGGFFTVIGAAISQLIPRLF